MKRLRDIRTRADKIDLLFHPNKIFLRLSCIEMEKTRLGIEKESATSRQKNIDIRLQEREEEKTVLLEAVNKLNDRPNSEEEQQAVKPKRTGGGFKVKY